jgi:hypothetical protein
LSFPPFTFTKSRDPPQFIIPFHRDMIYLQPAEDTLPNNL